MYGSWEQEVDSLKLGRHQRRTNVHVKNVNFLFIGESGASSCDWSTGMLYFFPGFCANMAV